MSYGVTPQLRAPLQKRGSLSRVYPTLVGTLALGFEVSNWYLTTRGMQNAADAAAIAAATNGGTNYDVEARAVAATCQRSGFQYRGLSWRRQHLLERDNLRLCATAAVTGCGLQRRHHVEWHLGKKIKFSRSRNASHPA
jgi:hypothetical protein